MVEVRVYAAGSAVISDKCDRRSMRYELASLFGGCKIKSEPVYWPFKKQTNNVTTVSNLRICHGLSDRHEVTSLTHSLFQIFTLKRPTVCPVLKSFIKDY